MKRPVLFFWGVRVVGGTPPFWHASQEQQGRGSNDTQFLLFAPRNNTREYISGPGLSNFKQSYSSKLLRNFVCIERMFEVRSV